MSDLEHVVLAGNVVDDHDFPYRVTCDDCGTQVGRARLVASDVPNDGEQRWLWVWSHDDPAHQCIKDN